MDPKIKEKIKDECVFRIKHWTDKLGELKKERDTAARNLRLMNANIEILGEVLNETQEKLDQLNTVRKSKV